MEPRSTVLVVTDACGRSHWDLRCAPNGPTKCCTGCDGRMRAPPLRPPVEPLTGPRNAVLGVADACPTGASGGAPYYGATQR
eukprot:7129183-Pyramimonas_sp.AAC.1